MIRRPPRSTLSPSSAASDVYKRQRTYRKWSDKSNYGVSALEVDLSGVAANAAGISGIDNVYGQVGSSTDVTFTLLNHGYNGVKSLDYSYKVGDATGGGKIDLDKPLPAIYNSSTDVQISIPAMDAKGKYPLTLTIDKINGEANGEATANEIEYTVYNSLPKRNPVMEEYTGTWCGWCPRGFVALELMNKLHPDFIGLSYHNGDAMEVMSSSKYPTNVSGFPSADIDRMYGAIDPYYGTDNSDFGIEKVWKANTQKLAPASAAVKAEYADNGSKISATATFVFPESRTDADKYSVEFVLVADDLHGEGSSWEQHNYYTESDAGSMPSPEADPFFSGESVIAGLHFNDVVVATTRLSDGLVKLPAVVGEDQPVEVTGEFDTAKVVSTSGNSLIQDVSKMRVVAILVLSLIHISEPRD